MNVLIVALEAVTDAEVSEAEALVVAPALNSRLRRWLSDEDEARRRAQRLAEAFVELLQQRGVHAEGRVGDADPLLAVADALPTFPADADRDRRPAARVAGTRRACLTHAQTLRTSHSPHRLAHEGGVGRGSE